MQVLKHIKIVLSKGIVEMKVMINYIIVLKNLFYYVNTNEIPGGLSRENMISLHAEMTCYLLMWKDQRCYGYIINSAFHSKKL